MTASFRPDDRADMLKLAATATTAQQRLVQRSTSVHMEKMLKDHGARTQENIKAGQALLDRAKGNETTPIAQWMDYIRDAGERTALVLDALQARAEQDKAHKAAGTPPVLIYDYETICDGRTYAEPCNYKLLKILPPDGVTIDDAKRPYIIIDPRAGHGAGIGGFKNDSQVGVALKAGHPVYFVAFGPHPEKGQTLTHVMHAEAEFVREVMRRHPAAKPPIVVGNCQGGWAALLLAAANPDITGPVVLNGSPVSTWSGRVGENPMRYAGGLNGGIVPALLMADLNNGELDGVHLVSNFENLDPARNFIGKYYDLYNTIDTGRERFLEFERWWGGYHFLAEAEIRWIVEELFIGNRVARNEARLEHGRVVDVKQIRSPIIVFASYGDNITPPQQALNWIADTYADEREIMVRGQRILYMVHEKVGHLGIFVSGAIAKREHSEISSTLETIESLPPGLYEMVVDDVVGDGQDAEFSVSFKERTMADIAAVDDGRDEETPAFAAVSRMSELGSELYQLTARPLIQAMASEAGAKAMQDMNPSRVSRAMFATDNPMFSWVAKAAETARADRHPVADDNMFRAAEKLAVDMTMQAVDLYRDLRDMAVEQKFFAIWSSPWMTWVGAPKNFERTRKDPKMLRYLPEVERVLSNLEQGGYAEGVARIMMTSINLSGSVKRDHLAMVDTILGTTEPFKSMGPIKLSQMIHDQQLIAEFEPEAGLAALPKLLRTKDERHDALATVMGVAGSFAAMDPRVERLMRELYATLDVPLPEAGVPDAAAATPAPAPAPAMVTNGAIAAVAPVAVVVPTEPVQSAHTGAEAVPAK